MPYDIIKNKDNSYAVINKKSGHILAKHTTLNKAKSQLRLLYGIDGKGEIENTRASLKYVKLPENTRRSLTGADMMKLNPDAKLLKYTDLYKYKSSTELFADCDKIILLYLTINDHSGHWCSLFKNKQGINYFDSYGVPIDYHFELLRPETRQKLNEPVDYLKNLLWNDNVIFNNITYQRPNTQTCGEHVSFRLNNSNMTNPEYLNFFL
jgi:hypothetical protein